MTGRCLEEDLGHDASSDFGDLSGIRIVQAFVRERRFKNAGADDVAPISCGKRVTVLRQGNDDRGGTWFDERNGVVWLLAAGHHRSGQPDDFFPYCRGLADESRLLPTKDDYRRMLDDRGSRLAYTLRIEAPFLLAKAQEYGAQRAVLGGVFGVEVEVEVADEFESTHLAIKARRIGSDSQLQMLLTAFHADGRWQLIGKMPSRPVAPDEIGYCHDHERS